jgi:methionyl-tRNA formyltransferase
MSEQRIILLCGGRFALPAIQQLSFFKQLAVVAVTDTDKEMVNTTKMILTGTGVPVIVVSKKTFVNKVSEAIKIHTVNTGLMLSFPYKLPAVLYQMPVKGFYNVHPGLLPAYRGPDPVFQQIRNKEKYAGVTIHKVDDDFNTGPVVVFEKIKLTSGDTYGLLYQKLAYAATKLTGTLLKLLSFDTTIPCRPQDLSKARYYQKQEDRDVSINWQGMDAATIVALINACNPWNKGAITLLNNKPIHLLEATLIESTGATVLPGTILSIDDRGLIVAALNNQAVSAAILFIDEGFLLAKRLTALGILAGERFDRM